MTLTLSADEFRKVAEGKTTIDDAVKAGMVKLAGSQATLNQFLSLFDTFDSMPGTTS